MKENVDQVISDGAEGSTDGEEATGKTPNVPCAALQRIPVFCKVTSPGEQLVIAYFPTSTLDQDPGSKITSVSRNLSDGRIRCEINNSTINAREETSEGIPVDYHMVWESSTPPTNTFRNDYYAVKKNGKIFLTPAQFVHMRAVVEPKGSRQENSRVGIVVQSTARNQQTADQQTAGQWVKYDHRRVSTDPVFDIDESNVQNRNARPSKVASADLETVIGMALNLKDGEVSPTGSGRLPVQRLHPGVENVEVSFRQGSRVKSTDEVQQLFPNKSKAELIRALKGCAYLVQGRWVGQGQVYFRSTLSETAELPYHLVFDYILSFFARSPKVTSGVINAKLKLSAAALNGILQMFAERSPSGGQAVKLTDHSWELRGGADEAFMQNSPDLVKEQQAQWEERRRMLETEIVKFEKLKLEKPKKVQAKSVPPSTEARGNVRSSVKRDASAAEMETGDRVIKTVTSARGRGGRGRKRGT